MNFLNLVYYGLVGLAIIFGIIFLLWAIALVMLPVSWVKMKITDSRCPKCGGFFKSKLANQETVRENEVLRTVNRVDRGVLHSGYFFEPDQKIEVNRKEQVTYVEQRIRNHWVCRNPNCSHQWTTEEETEYEGSLAS